MAKKTKTVFVCNECGNESSKWVGQCPACGAWNSMFEEKVINFDEDDKRRRTSGKTRGWTTGSRRWSESSNPVIGTDSAGSIGRNGSTIGTDSTGRTEGSGSIGRICNTGDTSRTSQLGKASETEVMYTGQEGRAERLVHVRSGETSRIDTGIGELNRVLGGGLVPGSLTLISGEPGIGKSTIILQAAQYIAETRGRVLYVSGEESEEQIRMRADRVCCNHGEGGSNVAGEGDNNAAREDGSKVVSEGGSNVAGEGDDNAAREDGSKVVSEGGSNMAGEGDNNAAREDGSKVVSGGGNVRARDEIGCGISENLFILTETNIENVAVVCENLQPQFLIVDSIQTMYSMDLESAPGSVSQVRACGNELMRIGKVNSVPVFIVAHVTKSGDLAGPRIVEHMVDCVLSFTGDRSHELRILRAQKNRFGTTSEIGAFEMAEEGLVEIQNLSGVLMEEMDKDSEGAVATAVYEGTRPLILEVQALTCPCNIGFARRTALGIDNARVSMIIAVLEKKLRLKLAEQDVYVNIVGGIRPEGTYTDLAVALAIYSSCKGRKLDSRTLVMGEIGLTGDLRAVQNADKIIKEAGRLGFKRIIMPEKNARNSKSARNFGKIQNADGTESIEVVGIRNITEAISLL